MEEEMTESKRETYLDSIPYHCGLSVDVPSPRIITTWANGMYGCVSVWHDYTIHYQEYSKEDKKPIADHGGCVGCGIIGFWLHYRYGIEDIGELFKRYIDCMYDVYYDEHKGDVDRWERDLRNETVNYCIKLEGKSSEYINTLYELISESDKMMIHGLKMNFMNYLLNLLEHPKQPEDLNEALCVIAHKDEEIAELKEEITQLKDSEASADDMDIGLRANAKIVIELVKIMCNNKLDIKKAKPQKDVAYLISVISGYTQKTIVNDVSINHDCFQQPQQVYTIKKINQSLTALGITDCLKIKES